MYALPEYIPCKLCVQCATGYNHVFTSDAEESFPHTVDVYARGHEMYSGYFMIDQLVKI